MPCKCRLSRGRVRERELGKNTNEQIIEAMRNAGIDPATIHAFQKTGIIPTERTLNLYTNRELDEFTAAAEEFEVAQMTRAGL